MVYLNLSDCYASLTTNHYEFYYGYKRTWCDQRGHGFDSDCKCEDKAWCFVAKARNEVESLDDELAIQAAIDKAGIGGTVLVPAGTYRLTTSVKKK